MAKNGIVAALAAGLLVGAAPAAAVEDLTGTYEAKLSCKGIGGGGVRDNQKTTTEIDVDDVGGGIIRFDMGAYDPGQGFLVTDAAKTQNGVLSGMTCNKSATELFGLVLRVEVKTKPGKDDATLKGTLLIFEDTNNESSTCKLNAKRTSTAPVKLEPCVLP